ncbi:unnamed protein product [Darwinula stevensoni]|uniref:MI domain-containing protein n=1 Tax=Darwinula stevensoni TaxID=69355 RepID=A0A7R9A2H1_9CRUS|nr:unnamed protein product [Darwinula stevensoni]CAG0879929.1 unnamed protein product [Darwinula stevensoni]
MMTGLARLRKGVGKPVLGRFAGGPTQREYSAHAWEGHSHASRRCDLGGACNMADWALKKSIHGLINEVNASNVAMIVREIFKENIVRGQGLLCRDLMQAQSFSPTFTPVYASLVSIIELLLCRLIVQFWRSFKHNDKNSCLSSTRFIAHLINHQICHEILASEILTLLLENPTEDSVEVRKEGFKDNPSTPDELDLIEEGNQFTHTILLDDATNGEEVLNVFKPDPEYQENEEKYKSLCHEILYEGDKASGEDVGSTSGNESDDEDESDSEDKQTILNSTETNLVALRHTIYLTIQSSLDFEEAAHKLTKLELKPGQEVEVCHMILDCCAQQQTNEKFFAHLLYTDAIQWMVLSHIKLSEEDTTSSSCIFIKLLFQELIEHMGLGKLNEHIKDPTLQGAFEGLFPRDNPQNICFAIISVGLGGLTDDLREHLAKRPNPTNVVLPQMQALETQPEKKQKDESSNSSSSDSSSSVESDEKEWKKRKRNKSIEARKSKKSTSKKKRKQAYSSCTGTAGLSVLQWSSLMINDQDQFLAKLHAICHEEVFGQEIRNDLLNPDMTVDSLFFVTLDM